MHTHTLTLRVHPIIISTVRLLIFKAAMLKDAGKPYSKDAAQAKLFASETATYSAHQAIQVPGEIGRK